MVGLHKKVEKNDLTLLKFYVLIWRTQQFFMNLIKNLGKVVAVSLLTFSLVPVSASAAEISGVFWYDIDEDGIRNGMEDFTVDSNNFGLFLPGVTVNLLDENGDPMLDGASQPITTETDENGAYAFTGLDAGTYIVSYEESLNPTPANQGGDDTIDNDFVPLTAQTEQIVITDTAEVVGNVDGGVIPTGFGCGGDPAPYTGSVYVDENLNGRRDADEVGLEGVTVTPINDANVEMIPSATNSDGQFNFVTANLPNDIYDYRLGDLSLENVENVIAFVDYTSIPGAEHQATGEVVSIINTASDTVDNFPIFVAGCGAFNPEVSIGIQYFTQEETEEEEETLSETGADMTLLTSFGLVSVLGAGAYLLKRKKSAK